MGKERNYASGIEAKRGPGPLGNPPIGIKDFRISENRERLRIMYWLFKEDPESYSFEDLLNDKKTVWEGVRNNLALIHLRQVKKGDLILFYQTGEDKSIVGIMKADGDAYAKDGTDVSKSKEISVEVSPLKKLAKPVPLSAIKSNPKFKDFLLVKISRLSVMPVPKNLWDEIMRLSDS
jgi:predicted RNA-binding protein with PUA-like domain